MLKAILILLPDNDLDLSEGRNEDAKRDTGLVLIEIGRYWWANGKNRGVLGCKYSLKNFFNFNSYYLQLTQEMKFIKGTLDEEKSEEDQRTGLWDQDQVQENAGRLRTEMTISDELLDQDKHCMDHNGNCPTRLNSYLTVEQNHYEEFVYMNPGRRDEVEPRKKVTRPITRSENENIFDVLVDSIKQSP